jgi:hypothetical protein
MKPTILLLDVSNILYPKIWVDLSLGGPDQPELPNNVIKEKGLSAVLDLWKYINDATSYLVPLDYAPEEIIGFFDSFGENDKKSYFANYKCTRTDSGQNRNIHSIIKQAYYGFPKDTVAIVSESEADQEIADVILKMEKKNPNEFEYIICSNDGDFDQFELPNVRRLSYSNGEFKLIKHSPETSRRFLAELILKGDASDSVPNVYSDDDHYLKENKERQKPIVKKVVDTYIDLRWVQEKSHDEICKIMEFKKKHYYRNLILTDLVFYNELINS